MATEATFTIRQVAQDQPVTASTEPLAETSDEPVKRKSIRDKRVKDDKKDKEEKKKSKKPPGYKLF